MHVPRSVQERLMKMNQAMERLLPELGRPPTPREIAERTGESVEDVLEAIDAAGAYSPASLDAPLPGADDGEARTVGDGIGSEDEHFGSSSWARWWARFPGAPRARAADREAPLRGRPQAA